MERMEEERTQESEIPWPTDIVEAKLSRISGLNGVASGVIYGYLHFYGPDDRRSVIPVTLGPSTELRVRGGEYLSPVWHIDISADAGLGVVSPSIQHEGYWHSPNPVVFRLVDDLKDPRENRPIVRRVT